MAVEHTEFQGGADYDPMTGNKKDGGEGAKSTGRDTAKMAPHKFAEFSKSSGRKDAGIAPHQQKIGEFRRIPSTGEHGQQRGVNPEEVARFAEEYRKMNRDALMTVLKGSRNITDSDSRAAALLQVAREKGYLDDLGGSVDVDEETGKSTTHIEHIGSENFPAKHVKP